MSEDGVTVRISGVGENGFTMEPNTSYLLYYVAYKKSNTSTSISEEPFKQWSTFTDKDALLKDFDCVYLVTISLTPESRQKLHRNKKTPPAFAGGVFFIHSIFNIFDSDYHPASVLRGCLRLFSADIGSGPARR